ncbi:LacI family DNA-binding transcriptional regulator [Gorillibacterium sp. CAU 1737]|uniref:LacI family DNA-binding transcriptional regulator n=1 Tax=Gorillibacterium sp. CAU 1737 TaxID=3140362 RepID=UPI00326178FE
MPSMKDVAKLAGVAIGTVSRVINGNPTVTDEVRWKVQQAIEQLQYVPNEMARNLKKQTSNLVALLVPTVWHPFFSELASYVEEELDSWGYKLLLCNSGSKPWKEKQIIGLLEQNKVAGILGIFSNPVEESVLHRIPVVSIDRPFRANIPCVTSDNHAGGKLALHELVKAGARRLAYLGSVPTVPNECVRRRDGFLEAASQLGIPVTVFEPEEPIGDWNAYLERFLDQTPGIDGIFASQDEKAIRYIAFAEKRGIRVPEDVKVIGYDGIAFEGGLRASLSTIRQPVEEMGRMAVRLLLQRIAGESMEEKVYPLPVVYRPGDTT